VQYSGSFDVEAFSVRFRFTAACVDAYAALDQYAFPWLPRWKCKAEKSDLAARVDLTVHMDQVAGEFRLLVEDGVIATASRPLGLIRELIQVLDEAIVQRLTTLRVVHAGAVAWRERVLLFPGATHAGKSALVTEFLRRGATYFSDEYALFDAEGRVHPYARPLLVRDGGSEQRPALAQELHAPIGDRPLRLGWIFALSYNPESPWSVAAVSQGEALMTLLRNTPHLLANSPEMVSVFQHAVSQAECFAGTRGDAADAVDRIILWIGA
jgi:hypothetical protein